MPWIHMQDYVEAICHLIQNPASCGPYNFSAPEPVTNQVFVQTLGKVLKRPSILPVPSFALRLLLGEMAVLALTSQRVVPARLEEEGFRFRFRSLEPALRDILKKGE
jgi:NAD dependent epimerase/dehydratase family enzyme